MQKICANELSEENNYCSLPLLQANTWAMFDCVISSGEILNLQCNTCFDVLHVIVPFCTLYALEFQLYIFIPLQFYSVSGWFRIFQLWFLCILNVCRNGNFGHVFKFQVVHTWDKHLIHPDFSRISRQAQSSLLMLLSVSPSVSPWPLPWKAL